MKNKSALFNIYFLLTAIFMLSASVMRTVALFTSFDFESSYFVSSSLIGPANSIMLGAVIFSLSYAFFAKRSRKLVFDFSSPLNYIFAGTLGAALVLYASHALGIFFKYLGKLIEFDGAGKIGQPYFSLALGILALLSVGHFVLGTLNLKTGNTKRADFGIITVVFLAAYSAYLYFDNTLPINAPAKILDQMAYIFSAIFFLYETRISIGREKWPRYTAFGFAAMLLTAYSAIPSLIVYIVEGKLVSNSLFEILLTVSLLLFILARLALAGSLNEDKENQTVALIKEAAAKRAAVLYAKNENPEEKEGTEPEEEDVENREDYYELNFDGDEESATQNTEDEGDHI